MKRQYFDGNCYKYYFKDPKLKTLILIHGLGLNQDVWAWQLSSLKNYNVLCPDGFSWEFNARAKMKGFKFKEVKIIHKKRKYGETKIYTYKNLPKIAFRHLIGMLKIKFLNG